jgi:hypothetical protein
LATTNYDRLVEIAYETTNGAIRKILVALHEATMGKRFEEIVEDEFNNVVPREARQIYLTVSSRISLYFIPLVPTTPGSFPDPPPAASPDCAAPPNNLEWWFRDKGAVSCVLISLWIIYAQRVKASIRQLFCAGAHAQTSTAAII